MGAIASCAPKRIVRPLVENVGVRGGTSAKTSSSQAVPHYSTELALQALRAASDEERLAISRVLDEKAADPLDPEVLVDKVCRAGGHGFANLLRGAGPSYLSILLDVAEDLKVEGLQARHEVYFDGLAPAELDWVREAARRRIPATKSRVLIEGYVETIERGVLSRLLVIAYERLDPKQRASADVEIAALARKLGRSDMKGVSAAAALLVLGNVGGFATYTLMSVVLSTVSMGTFGFGTYVFASSALSVLLGPVGWVGLGVYAGHKFASSNAKQTLQLVATVAMVRQRIT